MLNTSSAANYDLCKGFLQANCCLLHGGPLLPFAPSNAPNAVVKPDTDPESML
jgi:hypothetical protein